MGLGDKITEIEAEIARTQKNKATEHHLGALKAKLAKYRAAVDAPKIQSAKTDSFEVKKTGDARVALIGFPSVGKSTLLSLITSTFSKQSELEFTTLECISGKLQYNGASIQILDLPGIIDGASSNKGRGKQVIGVARTADLILMMLDPRRKEDKYILSNELGRMGIRLNKKQPNIMLVRGGNGIGITRTCVLNHIDEETIKLILKEYKIHNCQITIRDDITDEDFIDYLNESAVYINCIYCYNKVDEISYDNFLEIAGEEKNVVISCGKEWNIDYLKEEIWNKLELVRVYTRKKGENPNFEDPAVLRAPASVRDLCKNIHKNFDGNFKHALVWGRSAKHSPQKVGINHVFSDEDVVQLFLK